MKLKLNFIFYCIFAYLHTSKIKYFYRCMFAYLPTCLLPTSILPLTSMPLYLYTFINAYLHICILHTCILAYLYSFIQYCSTLDNIWLHHTLCNHTTCHLSITLRLYCLQTSCVTQTPTDMYES